jgi:hypothetical protein
MGGRVNSISVDVDHHQKNFGSRTSTPSGRSNGTPTKGRWGWGQRLAAPAGKNYIARTSPPGRWPARRCNGTPAKGRWGALLPAVSARPLVTGEDSADQPLRIGKLQFRHIQSFSVALRIVGDDFHRNARVMFNRMGAYRIHWDRHRCSKSGWPHGRESLLRISRFAGRSAR